MNNVYFDNSATTKTDERVIEAMMPYITENYGNPSIKLVEKTEKQ